MSFQNYLVYFLQVMKLIFVCGPTVHSSHFTLSIHTQGSETFTFTCDRWLARGEDDSAIERELVPDKIVQESTRKDGSVKKKEIDTRGKLECNLHLIHKHSTFQ